MKSKILIVFGLLVLVSSCAKEMPSIGGGNPEKEFDECLRLTGKGRFEDSVQCLEMFKARYPQTGLGQEAELRIGDAYFAKKDYLLAAESYSAFLKLHPRSARADYAYYRMGVAYYKESPKAIDRDQEYLEDAIEQLKIAVTHYPNSSYRELAAATLNVAKRRVAKRAFYVGRFYYRTGEYIACIPRFWDVVNNYADTGLAQKALYKIILANLKLQKLEGAKEAYSVLSVDFPKSPYYKKAERKLLGAAKRESRSKE